MEIQTSVAKAAIQAALDAHPGYLASNANVEDFKTEYLDALFDPPGNSTETTNAGMACLLAYPEWTLHDGGEWVDGGEGASFVFVYNLQVAIFGTDPDTGLARGSVGSTLGPG